MGTAVSVALDSTAVSCTISSGIIVSGVGEDSVAVGEQAVTNNKMIKTTTIGMSFSFIFNSLLQNGSKKALIPRVNLARSWKTFQDNPIVGRGLKLTFHQLPSMAEPLIVLGYPIDGFFHPG
jgi:hypothetical protein